MSIGLAGPIGWKHLVDYAVAATVAVAGRPNLQFAVCKLCGADLAAGQGNSGFIRDLEGPRQTPCYLCGPCVERVQGHLGAWMMYRKEKAGE
jgi:hypothetical protein